MVLTLAMVTATPALCEKAVRMARERARGQVLVHIYANACDASAASPDVQIRSEMNTGVVPGLQALHETVSTDVAVYMHDDVEIYEDGWDERFVRRFDASPECVLAGFGGAMWLGTPNMWSNGWDEEPFRGPFSSNMRAAEAHGSRITGDCRVATVDGFGFAVRTAFMKTIGGFGWWPLINHGYDHALACMARKHGKETWAVPIACEHYNASTSATATWQALAARHGGDRGMYLRSLVLLKEMFGGVLPMKVP